LHETYEIRPSTSQLILLLASYALTGMVIFFYIEPTWFKFNALALMVLLVIYESKRLIQQGIIIIRLHRRDESIELNYDGQSYFFNKNKVYQTRWFAILKLMNEHNTRILILNPDRFKSIEIYRRLRFYLRKLESADVA